MTASPIPPQVLEYVRRCVPQLPATPGATLLQQTGEMRLGPERPWMSFTAEQSVSATRTEFVWRAKVRMAPLVTGLVEDAFEKGRGRLDASLWGLLPVAHARGDAVDRGEAQRYLAELAWCPLALLRNPALHFESRSPGVVRVWVGDEQTYVDLLFDDEGDISGARTTTRSRGDIVQPWEGRFDSYRDFSGIRAPSRGEVWWETPAGPFVYWRGEITSLAWCSETGRVSRSERSDGRGRE